MMDAQDTRPRTYDKDGRIIWIQEPDPDLLPHVQTHLDVDVETKENDFAATVPNYAQLPYKKPPPLLKEEREDGDAKSPKNKKKPKAKSKKDESFTDTFYKPDYMQPPLIQTMKVRPGVVLACMG